MITVAVFLENSKNVSTLKVWINCGICPKIYFCIVGFGLGSVALDLHVSGLGLLALALTSVALITSVVVVVILQHW